MHVIDLFNNNDRKFLEGIINDEADVIKFPGKKPVRSINPKNPTNGEVISLKTGPKKQTLGTKELATISDQALDKAYNYGRSVPGPNFGWLANMNSAMFAKRAIESGITDIDKIAAEVHKGWATAAIGDYKNRLPIDPPTPHETKLRRLRLAQVEYGNLPENEKEKDRVVARALLQALSGKEVPDDIGMSEGEVVPMQLRPRGEPVVNVQPGAVVPFSQFRDPGTRRLEIWKQKVRDRHPEYGNKIRFVSKDNGQVVSAEIPGLDRSFGVFDIATEKGQVLDEVKQRLDPSCWKGYKKQGTKIKGGVRVNNCVPAESVAEGAETEGSATLAKIAASGDQGYEMIYDGLNGLLGTEAQIMLQDMYDDVSREHRLHPDDNYEEIVDRMMDNIEADYGQQGVAEGSEEKDPVWNKGTPMPKDYTCHCGIHVHPSVRKPGAVHAKDCPYAKKQGVAEGLNEMDKTQTSPGRDGDIDWTKKQIHLGPEHVIKAKDVAKHALKALDKTMKKSHADTPKKKGVAEDSNKLSELKKSTVKSYASKKQAEIDDVPSFPFKKPAASKAEHEKNAKGMMGALARLSDKKPTSKDVAEGQLDRPGEQDSAVTNAITRRILLQRTDLLAKYGPEKVSAAIDEVADFVGDVDEIGSSDVSAWIAQVDRLLKTANGQGLNEVSDEMLINYLTKVHQDAMKHTADPSKRSAEKRNKSVSGFNRAFNKLDSRPGKDEVDQAQALAPRVSEDDDKKTFDPMDHQEYIKQADALHAKMMAANHRNDAEEFKRLQAEREQLDAQARKGLKENEKEGRPRIRKYSKMRPDGSKAVRYEVLDYRGMRIPGQGTEGFDDLKYAKEFYHRNYDKLQSPVEEQVQETPAEEPIREVAGRYWCKNEKRWKNVE